MTCPPTTSGVTWNLDQPLAGLTDAHPRLLIDSGAWHDLPRRIETGPEIGRQWRDQLMQRAAELLEQPLLTRDIPDGKRLLHISRKALGRVELLGLAAALAIAVGALSAVGFFTDRVDAAMAARATTLLAADLVGNLDTALNYNSLAYDDGGGASAVNDWFDDAQVHRLRRDYEFHNLEVNLLGSACNIPLQSDCPCTLNMHWSAGVRYFRFDEDFQFATDDVDDTFTGTADELYHNINVENSLLGFQLGAGSEYNWGRLALMSDIKFGIYGNYMENHQSMVGGTGVYATIDNVASPYNGAAYNFNGSKTGVSFLGEVDLGLRYRVTSRWSMRAGWRAMAVTGVALSVHQFPDNFNFEDAIGAGDVERNGSMILHGGYVGAEYNY